MGTSKVAGALGSLDNKLDSIQNKLSDMSKQSNKNHRNLSQQAVTLSMQTNKHTSNEISGVNTQLAKMQEQLDVLMTMSAQKASRDSVSAPQVSCPDIHYRDGRRDSLSTITTAALSSAQPSSSTGDDYKTPKRSRIPPPSFYRRPPTADKPMWRG